MHEAFPPDQLVVIHKKYELLIAISAIDYVAAHSLTKKVYTFF